MAKKKNTVAEAAVETAASVISEEVVPAVEVETPVVEEPVPAPAVVEQPRYRAVRKARPKLDLNEMVYVTNGFYGNLTYKSRKTGYIFKLSRFGDGDYIELGELLTAKNSEPKFFENNWFIIDDPDVLAFLNVEKYYTKYLDPDQFNNIFYLTPDEAKAKITQLSKGQKTSLMYRALEMIETGELDSRKMIAALEEALEVQLVEQ